MYSTTEERLRTFVEKLAESLTEQERVLVRPGDAWAAYIDHKPPLLTYRLADVAVIGDDILSVTAHEIAHLLYTDPKTTFPFDTGKYPRAAHLLLNAVEDSRIERIFSDEYPGARSLFDRKQDGVYDGKVQKGFIDLPIKWRFILNVDRVLHGLEPWGDERDVRAVEAALDACLRGVWADSTQECANEMELPFRIMLELIKLEKAEDDDPGQQFTFSVPPELLGLPEDYMSVEMEDESGAQTSAVSDFQHGPADADDHQEGGTDGSPGKREQADGGGTGEGQTGVGEGETAGKSTKSGGTGAGGEFGDPNNADLPGDDAAAAAAAALQDKPTNIIEEMVNEERGRGSTNKTIDILSYRQRQRGKDAKEVERKMEAERQKVWEQLLDIFGRQKVDKAFAERMKQNVLRYTKDRAELDPEIRTLRSYARQVLRDNATERWGGNRTSGRRIKTHRLYRLEADDPRLMERKEEIGGKSYAIAVVVDQSSSMSGPQADLAYRSALVFLEAFEGIVETIAIGFSDANHDPGGVYSAYGYRSRGVGSSRLTQEQLHRLVNARTYKQRDAELKLRRATVPELSRTYSSTPMEDGMAAAIDELRDAETEVKAIVIITDGAPNSVPRAEQQFRRARALGYEVYGLFIGRRSRDSQRGDPGFVWLATVCDRTVEVRTTAMIPQAVYTLLRGIVRRRRSVV